MNSNSYIDEDIELSDGIQQGSNIEILQALQNILANHQGTSVGQKPRECEPDFYSGERSAEAVDSWLSAVGCYLQYYGAAPDQWVPYAITLLRGQADIWWRRLEASGEAKKLRTWESFTEAVNKEFRPIRATQLARDRLAELKQTGSVEEHVREFRPLQLLIPGMTDEEALDRFVRGLKPHIRNEVRSRFPTRLSDAESLALTYKTMQQDEGTWVATSSPSTVPTVADARNDSMDLDVIKLLLNALGGRLRQQGHGSNNQGGKPRFRERICYNCRGIGHISRECPSPKRGNSSGSNSGKGQARLM